MAWTRELETALAAAKAGGAVSAGRFETGIEAEVKNEDGGSYNIVTQADVEAERAVVEVIRRAFPGHAVFGEELQGADVTAALLASEDLWIVDPIDGTSNFFHGVPHFGVSVAYYRRGVPACGVVGDPTRDAWYAAAKGEGAYLGGRKLAVSPSKKLDEVLVGFGYYYDRGAMMEATLDVCREVLRRKSHGLRRMGCATLDLSYVATGAFGAFFEYELALWDYAAGRLIVEEAGGKVTTCHGDPLPLGKSSVLASNGWVHDELVALLDEAFGPLRAG